MDYFKKKYDNFGNMEGGSNVYQYQYSPLAYTYQNQSYNLPYAPVQHEQSYQQIQYQHHQPLIQPEANQFLGFNAIELGMKISKN